MPFMAYGLVALSPNEAAAWHDLVREITRDYGCSLRLAQRYVAWAGAGAGVWAWSSIVMGMVMATSTASSCR